mmetsp:Transcript_3283/g.13199  ORF Transcript_3283/g.13199 Transcript_3283/m.13199 type:complete len:273 (-) Transcript_3283:990-1808(-)
MRSSGVARFAQSGGAFSASSANLGTAERFSAGTGPRGPRERGWIPVVAWVPFRGSRSRGSVPVPGDPGEAAVPANRSPTNAVSVERKTRFASSACGLAATARAEETAIASLVLSAFSTRSRNDAIIVFFASSAYSMATRRAISSALSARAAAHSARTRSTTPLAYSSVTSAARAARPNSRISSRSFSAVCFVFSPGTSFSSAGGTSGNANGARPGVAMWSSAGVGRRDSRRSPSSEIIFARSASASFSDAETRVRSKASSAACFSVAASSKD